MTIESWFTDKLVIRRKYNSFIDRFCGSGVLRNSTCGNLTYSWIV